MNREEILAELATTESAPREAKLRSLLSALDSQPAEPAAESTDKQDGGGGDPPTDPQ